MVQIIVLLPVSFMLLFGVWPCVLGWSIRRGSEDKCGDCIQRYAGHVIVALSFLLAIGLGTWFVRADKEKSWTDPEPAVAAVGIAVGAVFAYSRLVPPAFCANFLEVIDVSTGEWRRPKLKKLKIGKGQLWPIFIEVHNACITAWSSYRITVEFQEGNCEVYPDPPEGSRWQWKTTFRSEAQGKQLLQLLQTNALAVGETKAIRFMAKAPDKVTEFKVRIWVVADGRLGESRRDLVIKVVDGLKPPSLATGS